MKFNFNFDTFFAIKAEINDSFELEFQIELVLQDLVRRLAYVDQQVGVLMNELTRACAQPGYMPELEQEVQDQLLQLAARIKAEMQDHAQYAVRDAKELYLRRIKAALDEQLEMRAPLSLRMIES